MFVLQWQVMSFATWRGFFFDYTGGGAWALFDVPNLYVSQLSLLLWCEMNVTTTEPPPSPQHHPTTSHPTPLY